MVFCDYHNKDFTFILLASFDKTIACWGVQMNATSDSVLQFQRKKLLLFNETVLCLKVTIYRFMTLSETYFYSYMEKNSMWHVQTVIYMYIPLR